MPASTSSCLTSLRTTGNPDAAIVCAICPPMVPAPTTAALNTNTLGTPRNRDSDPRGGRRGTAGAYSEQVVRRLQLAAEAGQRAAQGLGHRAADEEPVDDRDQRPALLDLVLEGQGHAAAGVARLERDPLRAAQRLVVDCQRLAGARLVRQDPLDDAAAA